MEDAFYEFISDFGYLAVGLLIFLENVFPPIPSELILPLAGFLADPADMWLPGVVASATAGAVLGAFVLYGVGRLLSRERLTRFFETRPMRLLGFKGDDIGKAVGWFDRKGQITVLVCRCVPVVRSLISIPAGTAKMNPARFCVYTLAGSAVWNTLLCSLGFAAGSAWEEVTEQAEWVSDIVKYVIVVLVVVAVVWWVAKRILPNVRRGSAAEGAEGIAGGESAAEGPGVAEGMGGIAGDASAAEDADAPEGACAAEGANDIADNNAGRGREADGGPESQNR